MGTHTLSIAGIAVLAASSSIALAGVDAVANGGFEMGSGTNADNWANIVGGPSSFVGRASDMPQTGSFSALMSVDHINNPTAGGAYFIEQVSAVGSIDGTQNYDLSFSAKVASLDFVGIDMFFQILWLDQDASNGGGVQGETLVSLIGAGINTEYQSFGLADTDVPDGADSFLLRFQLSAGAVDGIQNSLFVDNASLRVVPAPASIGLGALGLAAMGVRRRRNA